MTPLWVSLTGSGEPSRPQPESVRSERTMSARAFLDIVDLWRGVRARRGRRPGRRERFYHEAGAMRSATSGHGAARASPHRSVCYITRASCISIDSIGIAPTIRIVGESDDAL